MDACIEKLEGYREKIPDELGKMKQIRNIMASSQQYLAPECELEITERLLELYVIASDGALIL